MILSQGLNDQLMAMAAHRYCLGRRTYVVGACVEWIRATWGMMNDQTRSVMIRDTQEALDKDCAGMEMDRRDWTSCLGWMREHLGDPVLEECPACHGDEFLQPCKTCGKSDAPACPPPKRKGKIRAKLVHKGRGRPSPCDDPRDA